MNRRFLLFALIFCVLLGAWFLIKNSGNNPISRLTDSKDDMEGEMEGSPHALSIQALRDGDYPGSDFVIEQILTPGGSYDRYIVSYKSEGLKIYALLTVPFGEAPPEGWPAVMFNHGYIPPSEYRTTERYIAYTDAFSRNGYVLLRPDYRGHGESEGQATGGYSSNNYTIDVLNALASLKRLKDPNLNSSSEQREARSLVDPNRIGFWGHSMGGFITLRAMVVDSSIKAGVIWAGVVGSHQDLFERWRRRGAPPISPGVSVSTSTRGGSWRQALQSQYGTPAENPDFWNSLSANFYLSDISGPVQLHHGTADESVPVEFSIKLHKQLKDAGKVVELYTYEGDDHNITANFGIAAQRSVEFFDKNLK